MDARNSEMFFEHFYLCRYAINVLKPRFSGEKILPADKLCDEFFSMVSRKIVHSKEAFLLVDLLRDAQSMCDDFQLTRTSQLRNDKT